MKTRYQAMSVRNVLFLIFVLITSIQVLNCVKFCNSGYETKVTSVFSHKKVIFLIRKANVWRFNTETNSHTEPSEKLSSLFPGLSMRVFSAGFTVESIPSCDKRNKANEKKCKFIDHLINQTFVFYNKVNGKPLQTYSMVKFNVDQHLFIFDDSIGGFAYDLRTNKSFHKSSWPGIGPQYNQKNADKYTAAVFDSNKNELVLFGSKSNSYNMYRKKLQEEWDQKAVVEKVSYVISGAFSLKDSLYAVVNDSNAKQNVYQYQKSIFTYTGKTVGEFFNCKKDEVYTEEPEPEPDEP